MSDGVVEILRAIVRCADESDFGNLCDRDHGPPSESWPSQSDELHTAIENARAFISVRTGKDNVMSNDMVERTMKAMRCVILEITGGTLPDHLFEVMARAAIAAMREPTEEMLDVAMMKDHYWSINAIPRIKAAYRVMIDTALK